MVVFVSSHCNFVKGIFLLWFYSLYRLQHHCATCVSPLELPIRSNLRARISGDVQADIRLRPVNSMQLARKKGSPRCAVKLLFRRFINTVPNILQKNFFKEAISIKITIWAFLDVPTPSLRLFLTYISVSSYLDTCWVWNFKIILCYKN